jgi:hypothetical protein
VAGERESVKVMGVSVRLVTSKVDQQLRLKSAHAWMA